MSGENINPLDLRKTLAAFVTGVTVITTLDKAGVPCGVTVNSFSSVSLDPPLILWNQALTALSYPVFRDAERFAVNILAQDQIHISKRFASAGTDKFAGIAVRPGLGGIPLIDCCSAYLECRKETSFPGGDHAVFLGRVEKIEQYPRKSLIFGGGKYLIGQPHDLGDYSIDLTMARLASLHAIRIATPVLAELAEEIGQTLGLCVWGNHGPTVIRWEESRRPVSDNLRTGLVLPVLTSASGLLFAACLPKELTEGLIAEELAAQAARNDGALSTRADVDRMLEDVRANGHACIAGSGNFTDLYGTRINAISVPVFDKQGNIVLGLTAVGRVGVLDVDSKATVPELLHKAAATLSARLGYRT